MSAKSVKKAIEAEDKKMMPQTEEEWKALLGKQIGRGMSRKVYEHKYLCGRWVIKVENMDGCHFQNVREYKFWLDNHYDAWVAEWLAPVARISACGKYLMMKRTHAPIDGKPERPTHIPRWFTDLKIANWGILDGRWVCHDYGTLIMNPTHALKKATFTESWKEPKDERR